MQTKEIGPHKVRFYSDIDEIPEFVRDKMDSYFLIASELNPRLESTTDKFNTIYDLIEAKETEKAYKCVVNLQKSLMLCAASGSPIGLAYASTIKDFDGTQIDYDEESLGAVMGHLSMYLTGNEMREHVNSLKKKLISN